MRALIELFAVLSIKIRVVLACLIGVPLFLLRHDIYDSLMNFVLVDLARAQGLETIERLGHLGGHA